MTKCPDKVFVLQDRSFGGRVDCVKKRPIPAQRRLNRPLRSVLPPSHLSPETTRVFRLVGTLCIVLDWCADILEYCRWWGLVRLGCGLIEEN